MNTIEIPMKATLKKKIILLNDLVETTKLKTLLKEKKQK
jgi:hypothetical protein